MFGYSEKRNDVLNIQITVVKYNRFKIRTFTDIPRWELLQSEVINA